MALGNKAQKYKLVLAAWSPLVAAVNNGRGAYRIRHDGY